MSFTTYTTTVPSIWRKYQNFLIYYCEARRELKTLQKICQLNCPKGDHRMLRNMSCNMRFPTMWYVRPAMAQTSLRICAVWSESLLVACPFYIVWLLGYWPNIIRLLTEHHLEFLSLKGGCIGSSESTLVKMPHCWKSHVVAQLLSLYLCTSWWNTRNTVTIRRVTSHRTKYQNLEGIIDTSKFCIVKQDTFGSTESLNWSY